MYAPGVLQRETTEVALRSGPVQPGLLDALYQLHAHRVPNTAGTLQRRTG